MSVNQKRKLSLYISTTSGPSSRHALRFCSFQSAVKKSCQVQYHSCNIVHCLLFMAQRVSSAKQNSPQFDTFIKKKMTMHTQTREVAYRQDAVLLLHLLPAIKQQSPSTLVAHTSTCYQFYNQSLCSDSRNECFSFSDPTA